MATAMAAAAISPVLRKLDAVLRHEYKMQTGIRRDIDFLRFELKNMQDFLKLYELKEYPRAEEYWVEVRELSYDIEDWVDAFMLDMEQERGLLTPHAHNKKFVQKSKIVFSSFMMRYGRFAVQLHEVKSRLEGLRNLYRYMEYRSATRVTSGMPVEDPHRPTKIDAAHESSLVGVDGPREELAKLLVEEEPESASRLKVISIVGLGGLGKTSLARELYSTVEEYFDCGAWVSVSPKPNMMNILMGILRQVEDPHSSTAVGEQNERDLIRRIKESLQHKRYLLVLDDIWNTETWEIIKSALPPNSYGSRVITTTCMNSVAKSCCSHWNDHIYDIKPLSEMDSKELFLRRTFGTTDHCPAHLVDVSLKILKKCYGLPLAITTMSGLLAKKPCTRTIWEDVYNSISGSPEGIEATKNIFFLSYYNLPYNLKSCLLYLSIFPENHVINRDLIVKSWIAEGLITENHKATPEEVAESYLNELITRNMIQSVHVFYDDEPEDYIMHRMIREFIKSEAAKDNFITVLENEEPVSELHCKMRRLSIINMDEGYDITASMPTSRIRSLSIFGNFGPKLPFYRHLTLLRVLHLEGCKNLRSHSIKGMAKLRNLRYLSIRGTPITPPPNQFCRLRHLKTLDLHDTEVQELPASILELQKLAHIHCDKVRLPVWIGKMRALSCLSQIDIFKSEKMAVNELGNLSELKQLVLWWVPDQEFNCIERCEVFALSVNRLAKLQSLVIHGSDSSVDFLDNMCQPLSQLRRIQLNRSCYINRLPEWFRLLPSLAYVFIDIKEVNNEDLMLLSELPSLAHLSLSSKVVPTKKLVINGKGFPVLQEFYLHSARADITFEQQAMPKLEILALSLHVITKDGFCIKFDKLKCLRKIDIRVNGKGAAASQFFADAHVSIRRAADEHPNRPTVNILMLRNFIDSAANEGKETDQKLEPIKANNSNELICS